LESSSRELFRASLSRATQHPAFFQLFYQRFMESSDEIAAMFQDRDVERIQKKLKMTLETVHEHAEGQPGLGMYLEMLGRIHQRLKITPAQFDLWRDALIATASECDEAFDQDVRNAWKWAIDDVIDKIQNR